MARIFELPTQTLPFDNQIAISPNTTLTPSNSAIPISNAVVEFLASINPMTRAANTLMATKPSVTPSLIIP